MRLGGRTFTMLMLLVTTVTGVGARLPTAAQEASPAASPAASPVGLDGEAGWRVAEERPLEVDGEPLALSPDGQWLAGLGAAQEFCVWAVETLEATCAREELSIREETITWAPDSSVVAFALNAAIYGIDSDIYVFEVEAGELRNLTDDGIDDLDLFGREEGAEPYLIDDVPAWSPDSQALVFARTRWVPEGNHTTTMVRIAREGGETDTLFSVAIDFPFAIFFPIQWLEGDRLLYSVFLPELDNARNGLYIAGVDASDARQILPGDRAAEVPAPWVTDVTPDGRVATVYSRARQGDFSMQEDVYFLLDLESGELTSITTGAEPEVRVQLPPTLSPDGETLLFTVFGTGETLLAVQDVASGAQSILAGGIEVRGNTVASRGFDWAENDTVLIPAGDASRLLTLERVETH